MSRRLSELDALRGIAALAVVLFHYTTWYERLFGHSNGEVFRGYNPGFLGVSLFFIISGFVIFMTLVRAKNLSDFVLSRFSRLFPVYWAAVVITLLAIIFFPIVQQAEWILPLRPASLAVIATNFTMLGGFVFFPFVDPSYWSLGFELTFYFFMALLLKKQLLHRIDQYCIGLLAFFSVLIVITSIFPNTQLPNNFIPHLFTIPYAHLFIAGIMYYKIQQGEAKKVNYCILAYCIALQWALTFVHDGIDIYRFSPTSAAIVTSFHIAFLLFVTGRLKFIAIKPLTFLGTISYSLYLVHQILGYIIMQKLYLWIDNQYLVVASAIVIVSAIAAVLTYTVEKPAQKKIRSWYLKRQKAKSDLKVQAD